MRRVRRPQYNAMRQCNYFRYLLIIRFR